MTPRRLDFWKVVSYAILAFVLLFLVYPIGGLLMEAFHAADGDFSMDAFRKFFLLQKLAAGRFRFSMSATQPIQPKKARGLGGFLMHAYCYVLGGRGTNKLCKDSGLPNESTLNMKPLDFDCLRKHQAELMEKWARLWAKVN